jgi:hypothetical protein
MREQRMLKMITIVAQEKPSNRIADVAKTEAQLDDLA